MVFLRALGGIHKVVRMTGVAGGAGETEGKLY